jgi:hypothetical protein
MTEHRPETPEEIEAALQKRDEAFLQRASTVTRAAPAVPAPANLTREWRAYIDAADKSWLEASMAAVGQVLAEERKKMRAELELEVAKLRAEFLADRLDQARGVTRHRNSEPGHLKAVDTMIA